jgi:hypothetical protein
MVYRCYLFLGKLDIGGIEVLRFISTEGEKRGRERERVVVLLQHFQLCDWVCAYVRAIGISDN